MARTLVDGENWSYTRWHLAGQLADGLLGGWNNGLLDIL
jgi:hypothetical protein